MDGAIFTAPTNIVISAAASDLDGVVSKVEFFQGASKIGETNNAPFQYTWTNVPAGFYSVTARATDDAGSTKVSAPAAIRVNAPTLNVSYSSNQIVISWATAAGTYSFQVTDSLTPPVTWTLAPETPVINGALTTVTIAPGSGNKFYRLRSP